MNQLGRLFRKRLQDRKTNVDYPRIGNVLLGFLIVMMLVLTPAVQPVSANGAATTRYVATTGVNIDNNCTIPDSPCATIYHANEVSNSGDTIQIAAGIYFENLSLNKSITLVGIGKDETIIDGGSVISVIRSYSGDLSISDLTIRNGSGSLGGGVFTQGSSLTLTRVRVTGNHAELGGGIYANCPVTMTDSMVDHNYADKGENDGGGLFFSAGAVHLTNVTITGNVALDGGGGIDNYGGNSSPLTLINGTITDNIAYKGGGLLNDRAPATIINSTITSNHVSEGGSTGGIWNNQPLTIKNSIVSGNDGGNCFSGGGESSWTSNGYNLDSGNGCLFTAPTDLINTDPLLGTLQENGGETLTMALLEGSPAIDVIPADDPDCPATDQRGEARPYNTKCDIGAYEYYPVPTGFRKMSPGDSDSAVTTNPTLVWTSSIDVDEYHYCIDRISGDTCNTSWVSTGTSTTAAVTGLLRGTYYWQARAKKAGGYKLGDYGYWFSFTVLPAPGSFGKTSPAKDAKNRLPSLTLKWTASSDAAEYVYCYDKTNDGKCGTGWKSAGTTLSAGITNLAKATYYWQVRAKNANGDVTANGGTWWSFTVLPKPGAFGKTSPVNNSINKPTALTLYWAASANAAKYEYCLKKSLSAACTWKSTGMVRSVKLTGLLKNTKYYWQVRAKNVNGTTIANGGTLWNFTTKP